MAPKIASIPSYLIRKMNERILGHPSFNSFVATAIASATAAVMALVVASFWQASRRLSQDEKSSQSASNKSCINAIEPKESMEVNEDSVTEHACPVGLRAVQAGFHLRRGALSLAHTKGQMATEMGDKQVGGHLASEGKKGMLLLASRYLLKPVQSGKRRQREASFYEEIEELRANGDVATAAQLCGLDGFLSSYHGAVRLGAYHKVEYAAMGDVSEQNMARRQELSEEDVYLVFSDATSGMKFPCVMDVKLGQRTYEPDATSDKIERELRKYPRQAEAGFRFVGTRVFTEGSSVAVKVGKKEYQRVMPEGSLGVLRGFFRAGLGKQPLPQQRFIVAAIHAKVCELERCFTQQTRFAFTSASLLIVYDAAPSMGQSTTEEASLIDVRLIDLAHVRHGRGEIDESTLFGIQRMRSLLAGILTELLMCRRKCG